MNMLFTFFPLLAMVVTIINAFIMKGRVRPHIDQNPELEPGYNKLLKGFVFFSTIPWLIMGFGILTGLVNDPLECLNIRSMNPVAIAFSSYCFAMYLVAAYWVYFNGGAEMLAAHPGLIAYHFFGTRREVTSVNGIKGFFAIMIFSGVGALAAFCAAGFLPHLSHTIGR